MRDTHYKSFNFGNSFSDVGAAWRYLKGKDQKEIEEDDPDFFVERGDLNENVSVLSSSRRILKKHPRKQNNNGALIRP